MPGFHIADVMLATGRFKLPQRARAGSPWAVPLLVLPDGQAIRDSHLIATHAAVGTSLYPTALRASIDTDLLHFHDKVGPATRRFAYYYLFNSLDAAAFAEMARANGAPAWQTALLGTESVFQRARAYISKGLGVSKERAERAEHYIDAELAAVSARLEQQPPPPPPPPSGGGGGGGVRGLHGGATLSDLSFAALVSPVLGVSVVGADGAHRFPPPETFGDEFAAKAARWRETTAGRFAAELLARRDEVVATRE